MRFAIALDLRGLVDRLPFGARGRPVARERAALVGLEAKHQTVTDVAVVGNRQQRAARSVLPGLHPLPQILGVLAFLRGERQHLVGLRLAVAIDHVPVQVVARVVAGPLVADEGGEPAGLVVLLHDRRLPLPQRAGQLPIQHDRRHFTGGKRRDDFIRGLDRCLPARLDRVVPGLHLGIGEKLRVAERHFVHDAHRVRVVRDDEPIERPRQLGGDASRRHDLLATSEPNRLFRPEAVAGGPGVQRHGGVQVAVAPIDPGRVIPARVRREARSLEPLGGGGRIDLADVANRWGGFRLLLSVDAQHQASRQDSRETCLCESSYTHLHLLAGPRPAPEHSTPCTGFTVSDGPRPAGMYNARDRLVTPRSPA